jgi:hypothetical protein
LLDPARGIVKLALKLSDSFIRAGRLSTSGGSQRADQQYEN